MKKFSVVFLATILMGISPSLQSQQKGANISFEKTVHDYGKIQEADGAVTYSFGFTNTGSTPLVITRVVASCGCTTPDWTKQPIAPGEKGFVKVTFDPRNRPGQFSKSITVMSNSQRPNTVLRIQGEVIEREKTLEDLFPYKMGQLRLKSNHLPFVKIVNGQKKTLLTEVVNDSQEPVELTFSGVPAHLTITGPEKLAPSEKGIIEVSYDAGKKNDWGFVIDRVRILQNGKGDYSYTLTISATIEDDFTGMTPEELAKAPGIQFDQTTFDFGNMQQNATVEHEFVFTNTGKSDLIIRKLSSSCGCTAVQPRDNVIQPGKSSSIRTIFSSGTRQGRQSKTVTVITNDPKNSQIILRLTGNVLPAGN